MTSRSKGWVVGRVAGAPVVVTPSWLLAAVVLTFVFAPTVRAFAPLLDTTGVLVVSFAFVLLLFASVFLHEVAHALVARARGHEVTELAVTLWGGHTAYTGATRRPLDGALVAVVGPLTNLALAVALWFAFEAQTVASIPAMLLYAGAFSNAFVGLFNLLPGLPLDGGQILESLVWAVTGSRTRGTVAAGWVGRVVAVGVVLWALAWPLVEGRQASWVTVMWAALVGAFLWAGAGDAMATERRRARLTGLSVATLAAPAVVVRSGTTVAEAGATVAGHPSTALVVVGPSGDPLGWVDPAAAGAVPADRAASTPVDSALVPFPPGSGVDADLAGPDLLERLARTSAGARVVPVLHGGRVTGVLDVARVAAAVRR
ncbi:site-2 protease family protein [Isoptericola variabilis]|uniref:Zinc metalloprotease n=1 Tax=Isoptericola variabilis (strain 225) TaxID=743718 RepID=F6FTS9_ISOV2|nr:site-2 protease family protein [Isoptericola variabilis]AEG44206.1 peptidase M50 [Isoptericola variabilis 225]TWH28476.1 Zn-dependent protease [Isoptericola variabilis J7]